MSKRLIRILASTVLLTVAAGLFLYSYRTTWRATQQASRQSIRRFEVQFAWDNRTKNLRVIDADTASEEADQSLRDVVQTEVEPVIAGLARDAHLKRAKGKIYLSLLGPGKPYLVSISRVEITDPDLRLLMELAACGRVDEMKGLLAAGVDVNSRELYSGRTALMWAAVSGQLEVVRELLASRADPNAMAIDGETALRNSISGGHSEVVKVLLAAGADVNLGDKNGRRPLMDAAAIGDSHIVRMLLVAGANVNAKDRNGSGALAVARDRGQTEVVELLKNAGARE